MKIAVISKKSMKNILLFSVVILFVYPSCSSIYIIGNDFNEIRVADIVIGETEDAQIINMFGEPESKGLTNHYRVFSYSYEEYEFPPKSTQTIQVGRKFKSLVVVFDEQGRVLKYAYNLPAATSVDMLLMDMEMERDQEENTNNDDY